MLTNILKIVTLIVILIVTLIETLIMRPNVILIMKNSLLKYFNINNKSLIVC